MQNYVHVSSENRAWVYCNLQLNQLLLFSSFVVFMSGHQFLWKYRDVTYNQSHRRKRQLGLPYGACTNFLDLAFSSNYCWHKSQEVTSPSSLNERHFHFLATFMALTHCTLTILLHRGLWNKKKSQSILVI